MITDGENPIEVDDDDLNGTIDKINQLNVDMHNKFNASRYECETYIRLSKLP